MDEQMFDGPFRQQQSSVLFRQRGEVSAVQTVSSRGDAVSLDARTVVRIGGDEVDFIRFHAIRLGPIFDDASGTGVVINAPKGERQGTVFPILQPPVSATMYFNGKPGKILYCSGGIFGKWRSHAACIDFKITDVVKSFRMPTQQAYSLKCFSFS